MESDDANEALKRIGAMIVSDRPKLNVVRGVVSVAVCLMLIALVVFGREAIGYMLGPVRSLGLAVAALSLFMLPVFAWLWGTGQVTWHEIKRDWQQMLVMGSLVLFGLCSWLLQPVQNIEIVCEVCGIDREYEWHLTPVYTFHCEEDAIEKARELDKTRIEWARNDDGQFVEYEVEIKGIENWPVFKKVNRLLGTHIGLKTWRTTLREFDGYRDGAIDSVALDPREYMD